MQDDSACPLRGLHVLLVEDDYFIAQSLVRSFAACGAVVVGPVATVGEALAIVNDGQALEGAVLDIDLRSEKAFPVADALAARGIPFVFATGYSRTAIPARYAAVPRCEKPVDPIEAAIRLLATARA